MCVAIMDDTSSNYRHTVYNILKRDESFKRSEIGNIRSMNVNGEQKEHICLDGLY